MKNLILILYVILFVSCSDSKKNPKTEKTDLQKSELNGNVKSIEEKYFEGAEKFGEPVKTKLKNITIVLFDKSGKFIENKTLYPDGSLKGMNTYKYNKNGKLIEDKWFQSEGLEMYHIYKYDKKGNNIEDNHYESNGKLIAKTINKFDLNNNEVDSRVYVSNGSLYRKTLSKFDDDNFKIQEEVSEFDGSRLVVIKKESMENDERGNVIKENSYDEKGNLEYFYMYNYDEKDNKLEETFSKEGGNIKKTNKHNKLGHCFEGVEYLNDVLKDKFINVFQYDNKGNWVKRIHYNNGVISSIDERKIKYYD
jgi:uncharacterized protein YcfL